MPINVEVLGGVPATTLASSIITGATSVPLASGTGFPDGSNGAFYIVIDRGLSTQEVVKCASRSGTTITVASGGRGADGSTDQGHTSGATVEHVAAAETVQAVVDHADQTTGSPHGTAYLTPSGNAATASKWQTARTLALSGDVTGSNTIDGSGNVTITTTVTDDSHDHTSAITGTAANLTAAAWSSHTPAWTNFTLGNGSASAYYIQIGKVVHYYGMLTLGSTSSFSGNIQVDLPVAAERVLGGVGSVLLNDNGTQFYVGVCHVKDDDAGEMRFKSEQGGNVDATTPHTWGTGDTITWSITYEAA